MPEVTAAEAKQIIDAGGQLVDVRTDAEYEAGHIPSSRHVPMVIIYCRSGNRSGPAAEAFAVSGWDAKSIEGGLIAWSEAGFELEPNGGSVIDNPNMPPR